MVDNEQLRLVPLRGEWSIEYKEGFTKQTKKGKANYEEENLTELPGRVPDGRDEALLKYMCTSLLSSRAGTSSMGSVRAWHMVRNRTAALPRGSHSGIFHTVQR